MFLIDSEIPKEFFTPDTPSLSIQLTSRINSSLENEFLLLFIINFDDFMCMSCLDSFLSFCQVIPPRLLENKAWGILVQGNEDATHTVEKTAQIAEKKLRGFIAANNIKFPIVIDYNQVFHPLTVEGTALVIIHSERKKILRFNFPIKSSDAEKILGILLRN